MKTSATKLILEKLSEVGEATIDVFFPSHYSFAQASLHLFGLDASPRISLRSFSAIISRLRKQGLVERKTKSGKSLWLLTGRGQEALRPTQRRINPPDGIRRLVIFDVPERERNKRDILRAELVTSNFQQLQKSVWIGESPLSGDFINMLDRLGLHKKVHIFSVVAMGTLEE